MLHIYIYVLNRLYVFLSLELQRHCRMCIAGTCVSLLAVEPTVIDAMGNNETESVSSKAVNLTCPVDGAPLFFTWLKGATEVPIEKGRVEWSNTSNTLQILSAKSSDAGSYQCQGRNTRGTARATVTLEVFCELP